MESVAARFSSPRFQRYLLWIGVAVFVIGAAVLTFTLVGGTDKPSAVGGGAIAQEGVVVIESIVSGNVAQAPTGKVYGGGFLTSTLVLKYSTISNNTAASAGTVTEYGSGGGFVTISDTTIFASTIDHNLADAAGGVSIRGSGETQATIALTTISSNVGTLGFGALDTMADLTLRGSTIAFNTSGPTVPAGVTLSGSTTDLQSTIIADNAPMDLAGGGAIFGNNSLVKIAAPGTTLPVGTLTLDPKLGPLAFNGGPTRTHALGAGSPALGAGFCQFVESGRWGRESLPAWRARASAAAANSMEIRWLFR